MKDKFTGEQIPSFKRGETEITRPVSEHSNPPVQCPACHTTHFGYCEGDTFECSRCKTKIRVGQGMRGVPIR